MFRAPRTQQARAGPWNQANPQELNSRNCRPQEPSAAASICRGHGRCAAATRGSGSQPSSYRPTSPGDGNRRPCARARSSGGGSEELRPRQPVHFLQSAILSTF
eukprot:scaffold15217_cov37-Phaeocystis_antarctica.AAC.1